MEDDEKTTSNSTENNNSFFENASKSDPYENKLKDDAPKQESITGQSSQNSNSNQQMASNGQPNMGLGNRGNQGQIPGQSTSDNTQNNEKKDNEKKDNDKKDTEKSKGLGEKKDSNRGNALKKGLNKAKNGVSNITNKLGKNSLDSDSGQESTDNSSSPYNMANKVAKKIPAIIGFIVANFVVIVVILTIIVLIISIISIVLAVVDLFSSTVNYERDEICNEIYVDAIDMYGNQASIVHQSYIEGLINAKYVQESDEFIKTYTIFVANNIYWKYGEKDSISAEEYFSNLEYKDAEIPAACKYIFCDGEENSDSGDDTTYRMLSSETPRELGKEKIVDCVMALEPYYEEFAGRISTKQGNYKYIDYQTNEEHSGKDEVYTTDVTTSEVKERFRFKEVVAEAMKYYYQEQPEDTTDENIDKIKQLVDEGKTYDVVLKELQGKEVDLELRDLYQCNFQAYNCSNYNGTYFSCNGKVSSPPGFGYTNSAATRIAGLSHECVGWAKYRYAEIALSLGKNVASDFIGGWGNGGFVCEGQMGQKYQTSGNPADAQPGAIVSWKQTSGNLNCGNTYCGHVAIVESVDGDTVTISEGANKAGTSLYNGRYITLTKSSGLRYASNYQFECYIYPLEECNTTTTEENKE